MAYKTTKIKSGMTLPKLAEQYGTTPAAILQANKIPKLSAGMVVKIPPPPKPMQPGMDLQNPYNQFSPTVQSSFISGSGQINYNTQTNPIRSQGPLVNSGGQPVSAQNAYMQQFPSQGTINQQPLPTGSFVSGGGQVNMQGQPVPQAQAAAPAVGIQQRPEGIFDPNADNAQAWMNYWNRLPTGTPKSNVYIPTKSEVWLMKGRARRRKQEEAAQDNANYSAQNYVPSQKKQEQPIGNASNQSVTWRIG